jgi:ABC-type antimicrobial peptide transport system permease subunit
MKEGRTLLHMAVWRESLETVKYLVEKGVDLNERDFDGRTPLRQAVKEGYFRIVKYLVEKGVDLNERDFDGRTPLRHAVKEGYFRIVKFLVENGADVNIKENNTGSTPLHVASQKGNLEIVQILVHNGADVECKDSKGKTPIDLASKRGHEKIVLFLQGPLYNRLNVGNAKTNAQTEFINSSVMQMNAEERRGKKFFYNVDNVDPTTKKAKRVFQKELLNTFEDMDKDTKHPFTRKEWQITNEERIKQTLKRLPNTSVENSPTRNNQVQQIKTSAPQPSSIRQASPSQQPQAHQQEGGKKTKEYITYKGKKYIVRYGTKGGKYVLVEGEKIYLKK